MLTKLAIQSMLTRRVSVIIAILCVALSVMLLCGSWAVEVGIRQGFARSLAGTDVIVGARGSPINLLLYSLFQVGSPLESMDWSSYQRIAKNPEVSWTIPIALGDNHKSFRVLASNQSLFENFRFGHQEQMTLAQGRLDLSDFSIVIGSQVAKELGYVIGTSIILGHGSEVSEAISQHSQQPFRVAGILAPTATPLDRTLLISLESTAMLHHVEEDADSKAQHENEEMPGLSAVFVKLKSKYALFDFQDFIRKEQPQPLTAAIPGLTVSEIWSHFTFIEKGLQVLGIMLLGVSLSTIFLSLYTSLEGRRREMSVLRVLGASPWSILMLFTLETLICLGLASLLGLAVLKLGMLSIPFVFSSFSEIALLSEIFSSESLWALFAIFLSGFGLATITAWQAYRRALQDGLIIQS